MNDLVSIITPCYNGEKYLPAFLQSIISQTWRPIEFIFVDDGSTDHTKAVFDDYLPRLNDSGIQTTYIYQKNAGAAAAINQGLAIFSGEYLMWVDSDDILLPENVEKKVRYLQENPEYGFVLTQAFQVKEDNLDVHVFIAKRDNSVNSSLFDDLLEGKNVVFNPCVIMVRRGVFDSAISTRKIYESKQGQNWQMMLPIAYISRCGYIDEPLAKIVEHEDSHSRRKRDYYQQIERNNEFEELLIATIRNIRQMPESEKLKRIKSIIIRYTRENVRLSHHYFRWRNAKEYRKKLKKHSQLRFSDTLYGYLTTALCRKVHDHQIVSTLFRKIDCLIHKALSNVKVLMK